MQNTDKIHQLTEEIEPYLIAIDQRSPCYEMVEIYLEKLYATCKKLEIDCIEVKDFELNEQSFELWLQLLKEEVDEGCPTPPAYSFILPPKILSRALEPFTDDKIGAYIKTFLNRVNFAIVMKGVWQADLRRQVAERDRNQLAQKRHYAALVKGDALAIAVKDAYKEYMDACAIKRQKLNTLNESVKIARANLESEYKRQVEELSNGVNNKRFKWRELKILFESPCDLN